MGYKIDFIVVPSVRLSLPLRQEFLNALPCQWRWCTIFFPFSLGSVKNGRTVTSRLLFESKNENSVCFLVKQMGEIQNIYEWCSGPKRFGLSETMGLCVMSLSTLAGCPKKNVSKNQIKWKEYFKETGWWRDDLAINPLTNNQMRAKQKGGP